MRSPGRRRPPRREIVAPAPELDLAALARRVSYVGSAEHKSYPSFAGPPMLRADASKCDPSLGDQDTLTGWLQKALAAGQVGGLWEGDFPRYAWAIEDGICYEARLVNQELGQYKGFPLERDEWPEGLA